MVPHQTYEYCISPQMTVAMGYLRALEKLRSTNLLYLLRQSPAMHRVAAALDFPLTMRFAGISFPIYASSSRNISFILSRGRLFEADERRHFAKILDMLDVRRFWDIGANIGIYGFSALSMRPFCHIVLVEPDQYNRRLLRKTIDLNRLTGVSLVEKAVSDTTGKIQFLPDDITGSAGSIFRYANGKTFAEIHYNAKITPVEVESTTLDVMLGEFGPPDFIKIDVEGAELAVFGGGRRTITQVRPTFMFEANLEQRQDVAWQSEIDRLLLANQYSLFDLTTLLPIARPEFNSLAVPDEKVAAVRTALVD
jgi:FkbM family methyltransferase